MFSAATELAASTAELTKLISSGTAPELPAYDVDLGISVEAPGVLSSTVGVYHTGVPGFAPDLLPPVGGPAEEEERDIAGVLPPVGRPVEEEERDIAGVPLFPPAFAVCLISFTYRTNHAFV